MARSWSRGSAPTARPRSTASRDKTVRLWNPATGKPLLPPLVHKNPLRIAVFSPDGKRILTGTGEGNHGPAPFETIEGGKARIAGYYGFAGKWIPAGSGEEKRLFLDYHDEAILWDAITGKPLGPALKSEPPGRPVHAAAFRPDGQSYLLGTPFSVDGASFLSGSIQVDSATQTFRNLIDRSQDWFGMGGGTFSPDSRILLTGPFIFYDVATGKRIWNPVLHRGQTRGTVARCAFGPDGKTLFISDSLGEYPNAMPRLSLYEVALGQLSWTVALPDATTVGEVGFTSDGTRVLRMDGDTMFVHDARDGKRLGVSVEGDGRDVEAADLRRRAAPGQRPLDLRPRLPEAGFKPIEALVSSNQKLVAVAISPDRKTVVIADRGGPTTYYARTRLWDVDSGRFRGELLDPVSGTRCVAYSPDGTAVLIAGGSGAILADADSGEPRFAPLAHENDIECLAYSPDGKTVVTGSLDRTARIWDATTGRPIGPPLVHQRSVVAVAYSPDGKTILTGSEDGTARLWVAATAGSIGTLLLHQGAVRSVAFGPDGQTVLTGSEDGTARLWDLAGSTQSGIPLVHRDRICAAAYKPDGRTILTACQDGTVQLWDAKSGHSHPPIFALEKPIDAAAFSPDGKTMILGLSDAVVPR